MDKKAATKLIRWRDLAEEARVLAETLKDRQARLSMQEIAAAYSSLASYSARLCELHRAALELQAGYDAGSPPTPHSPPPGTISRGHKDDPSSVKLTGGGAPGLAPPQDVDADRSEPDAPRRSIEGDDPRCSNDDQARHQTPAVDRGRV